MNRNPLMKQAYLAPRIEVLPLETENLMQFSGQHKPIDPGQGGGDAKHSDFFEEEDADTWENDNIWNPQP